MMSGRLMGSSPGAAAAIRSSTRAIRGHDGQRPLRRASSAVWGRLDGGSQLVAVPSPSESAATGFNPAKHGGRPTIS